MSSGLQWRLQRALLLATAVTGVVVSVVVVLYRKRREGSQKKSTSTTSTSPSRAAGTGTSPLVTYVGLLSELAGRLLEERQSVVCSGHARSGTRGDGGGGDGKHQPPCACAVRTPYNHDGRSPEAENTSQQEDTLGHSVDPAEVGSESSCESYQTAVCVPVASRATNFGVAPVADLSNTDVAPVANLSDINVATVADQSKIGKAPVDDLSITGLTPGAQLSRLDEGWEILQPPFSSSVSDSVVSDRLRSVSEYSLKYLHNTHYGLMHTRRSARRGDNGEETTTTTTSECMSCQCSGSRPSLTCPCYYRGLASDNTRSAVDSGFKADSGSVSQDSQVPNFPSLRDWDAESAAEQQLPTVLLSSAAERETSLTWSGEGGQEEKKVLVDRESEDPACQQPAPRDDGGTGASEAPKDRQENRSRFRRGQEKKRRKPPRNLRIPCRNKCSANSDQREKSILQALLATGPAQTAQDSGSGREARQDAEKTFHFSDSTSQIIVDGWASHHRQTPLPSVSGCSADGGGRGACWDYKVARPVSASSSPSSRNSLLCSPADTRESPSPVRLPSFYTDKCVPDCACRTHRGGQQYSQYHWGLRMPGRRTSSGQARRFWSSRRSGENVRRGLKPTSAQRNGELESLNRYRDLPESDTTTYPREEKSARSSSSSCSPGNRHVGFSPFLDSVPIAGKSQHTNENDVATTVSEKHPVQNKFSFKSTSKHDLQVTSLGENKPDAPCQNFFDDKEPEVLMGSGLGSPPREFKPLEKFSKPESPRSILPGREQTEALNLNTPPNSSLDLSNVWQPESGPLSENVLPPSAPREENQKKNISGENGTCFDDSTETKTRTLGKYAMRYLEHIEQQSFLPKLGNTLGNPSRPIPPVVVQEGNTELSAKTEGSQAPTVPERPPRLSVSKNWRIKRRRNRTSIPVPFRDPSMCDKNKEPGKSPSLSAGASPRLPHLQQAISNKDVRFGPKTHKTFGELEKVVDNLLVLLDGDTPVNSSEPSPIRNFPQVNSIEEVDLDSVLLAQKDVLEPKDWQCIDDPPHLSPAASVDENADKLVFDRIVVSKENVVTNEKVEEQKRRSDEEDIAHKGVRDKINFFVQKGFGDRKRATFQNFASSQECLDQKHVGDHTSTISHDDVRDQKLVYQKMSSDQKSFSDERDFNDSVSDKEDSIRKCDDDQEIDELCFDDQRDAILECDVNNTGLSDSKDQKDLDEEFTRAREGIVDQNEPSEGEDIVSQNDTRKQRSMASQKDISDEKGVIHQTEDETSQSPETVTRLGSGDIIEKSLKTHLNSHQIFENEKIDQMKQEVC